MNPKRFLKRMVVTAIAGIMFAGGAYAQEPTEPVPAESQEVQKDIIETARELGSLNTLLEAMKTVKLVETLKDKGPFTLFAPTDLAFAELSEDQRTALFEDTTKLRAVLEFHILRNKLTAKEMGEKKPLKTLSERTLSLTVKKTGGIEVEGANVIKIDMECSNGVIHAVDSLLMLQEDIIDVARKTETFKTLLKACDAAGLTETLHGEGPYTLFAPSDEAFRKLPEDALKNLMMDVSMLKKFMSRHVVSGEFTIQEAAARKTIRNRYGHYLTIVESEGGFKVDGAKVAKKDIKAINGIMHSIETVLMEN